MVFSKLKSKLARTHNTILKGLQSAFGIKSREVSREAIEEALITADIGVETSMEIVDLLNESFRWDMDSLREKIKSALYDILKEVESPLEIPHDIKPFVIMVVGVNGTGKTTTIGKLAAKLKDEGKRVLLGACDTFRAAAIEQLEVWAERVGIPIIKHKEGADPGAVAFDTVKAGVSRGVDVVILDTAGRLHTKVNLMEELKKINRVVGRELEGAPHERLLVVDGSTGQNALNQARLFNEGIGVTGIVVTKLDGTAKGGIVVPMARELKIPIRFIGVGESKEDLRQFNAQEFVDALI